MTTELGATASVDGRFRPESISHFKEVAKNMAWLLGRPLHKCQEDLARIYGYSGLHELQQVLKRPGSPGPFDPRYNYLSSNDEARVEGHDRRIYFVLFGVPKGYWRDEGCPSGKCCLVFEMGLFQEAAEHRACFEKLRQVLSYEVEMDRWPLIHGWPLGLRSWLASNYTEPVALVEGWQTVLPQSQYCAMGYADIGRQLRMTGLVRLATMFKILAPRVGGRKPNGMGGVAFDLDDNEVGGITESLWEAYYFVEWLTKKLSREGGGALPPQKERIQAFVQRPSRATAAACEFVKDLKDPVGFRDRWAFESLKAELGRYNDQCKASFTSSLEDDALQSLFLHMDGCSAQISEGGGFQLWQFHYTRTEVAESVKASGRPALQPVIHANGSLIVPYDQDLVVMSANDWYFGHGDSDFASEAAAVAFEELYLPAIGVKELDFTYNPNPYSIVEIDELLLAPSVTVEVLEAYFVRLFELFEEGEGCLTDSQGIWCTPLSLRYDDEDENLESIQDDNADYVDVPSVLLINVPGCGLTFVEATHQDGKPVSIVKPDVRRTPTPSGEALATMVMAAAKGVPFDIVVYDSGGVP